MTSKRVLPLLIVVFIGAASLQAQKAPSARQMGEIRGQITYPDGRPASLGLAVYLEMRLGGISTQTQTDRQGKFEFTRLDPNVYVIRVHAPGYLPQTQEVDLTTISMGYTNIVLKPDPKNPPSSPLPAAGPGASVSALDAAAPDDARQNLSKGRDLLTEGKQVDQSIDYFQKAISVYPKYSEAYLLMGIAYSSQGKWSDAEQSLQKSIALNNENPAAFLALGAAQNQQKNYAAAEKNLLQAVVLAPDSADAQLELGNTYWGLQRWSDAEQHVTKANALRPNHSGQHILMGNILLRERNAQGALQQYKQAVQLDPNGPFAESARQMIAKIEAALAAAKK